MMGFTSFKVLGLALLAIRLGGVDAAPHTPNSRIIESRDVHDCPSVWAAVAVELRLAFLGCNRPARSSIRFAFHDAGGYSSLTTPYSPASGGADGSLLLSDEEAARPPNAAMKYVREGTLLPIFKKYEGKRVGAADFVQFAGAVGVRSCLGGVRYKTVVGRTDNATPPPEGTLPPPFGANASYTAIIQMFAEKGFNERDVAALMGAHSVSKAVSLETLEIPVGAPQDSTPNVWDTAYFKETQAASPPPGVWRFESDVNLAKTGTKCGDAFTEFGDSMQSWTDAFEDAMYRLSILGIDSNAAEGFVDCSHYIL